MPELPLYVTIHDESDPVLAVVTNTVEPKVYRDYRGMYDRPVTAISQRDFAEWVVIEYFPGYRVQRSAIILHNDEEMVTIVKVVVS